jgi:hypothetical protein
MLVEASQLQHRGVSVRTSNGASVRVYASKKPVPFQLRDAYTPEKSTPVRAGALDAFKVKSLGIKC